MFKYGANPTPPTSSADETTLDAFRMNRHNYKLYNRFQVRYLVNDAGTAFKGYPTILRLGTAIGTTKDPIFGMDVPGTSGPQEGVIKIRLNKVVHQTNDGSPDDTAVDAFNTLMNPLKWSHIGSTVSLGIDQGLRFDLLNQVYPTYNIYERQKDGSFIMKSQRPQAPNPKDCFSLTPYDPPLMGPAPFIVH